MGRWVLFLVAWASAAAVHGQTLAPTGSTFVLGTSQAEDTLAGKLQRRIYGEAFRRLGLPLQLSVMPLQRLSAASDQGQIDGDVARVRAYGDDHPELVRVEEPVYEVVWALYATNPAVPAVRAPELAGQAWRATWLRGAAVCERALKGALPADRVLDVSTDAQGFHMLRLGRADVHCTADLSALALQVTPEFRDTPILRRVLELGTFPLHAYLHRRHAELAPRLAAVLRQMKAERLIERYRTEALAELGLAGQQR